jgi:acyl carrier protein
MTEANQEKLKQIFRLIFELDDDADPSGLRRITEARWDSLANVTLVTALESEFGVTLDAQDIERLSSYQATAILLAEKGQ